MGENFDSLEELWKAFDKIVETFMTNVNVVGRGEILQKFMKEKLRVMADRVVKNINTQSSMIVQSKESEIATLKEIIVQLCFLISSLSHTLRK